MTEPVQPAECLVGTHGDGWESYAEVHTVDEITVAADAAGAICLANFPSLQVGLYLKRSSRFARPLTPIAVQSLRRHRILA